MLSQLIDHQSLKSFIEANGDDILVRIEAAEDASRDDYQAAGLLRKYRRLSDKLSKEQIVLSDEALKYALARETENERDDYKYDPQVASAIRQLGLVPLQGVGLDLESSESPAEN